MLAGIGGNRENGQVTRAFNDTKSVEQGANDTISVRTLLGETIRT